MKKNIIITGTNGMLGKDILLELMLENKMNIYTINRKKSNDYNANEYICDLTDFASLNNILNFIKPDIIIHCAANVNVDSCEQNKDYAYKVNSESTKILAEYNFLKTKFIYISTDSIFNGKTGGYREEDIPDPLNYYAFTKLEGERMALKVNPNSIIIRTNIYGLHKPFLGNSLVEWALKNLENKTSISGFNDVFFNPVYTKQLAKVVLELMRKNFNGVINVASKEKLSKYDFLIRLAEVFNIEKELINKQSLGSTNFKAKRPKDTTLNIKKLSDIINYEIGIDEGINALYKEYSEIDFIREVFNE